MNKKGLLLIASVATLILLAVLLIFLPQLKNGGVKAFGDNAAAFKIAPSSSAIECIENALKDERSQLSEEFFKNNDPIKFNTFSLDFINGKPSLLRFAVTDEADGSCTKYQVGTSDCFYVTDLGKWTRGEDVLPLPVLERFLSALDKSDWLNKMIKTDDSPVCISYWGRSVDWKPNGELYCVGADSIVEATDADFNGINYLFYVIWTDRGVVLSVKG